MTADPEALLAALDPEQRAVATALRGPVCVLAGAGTGKTRAITHRIAYGVRTGVYRPSQVLAVTFTTRAAGELRGRLSALGAPSVQARTFHSAALRQAQYFWPKVYGTSLPELVVSKMPGLAEATRRCRVKADQGALRDLASEIEWAKVSNVTPDQYRARSVAAGRAVAGFDASTVERVYSVYEEVKRERGKIDMEDILLCAVALLAESEWVTDQVHEQYRSFVVDEYQDVSPVQQSLLDLWTGDRDDLCVVGDPAQTIYSFAGATSSYLSGFQQRHSGAALIELVRDYRSTPQVVAAANLLMAGPVRLQAQRPPGPEPVFRPAADEVAEAETVAAEIAKLRGAGTPLGEMAVLYRVNSQSEAIEQALADKQVACRLRGGDRFFDRPEVKEAVVRLRGRRQSASALTEAERPSLRETVRDVMAEMAWSPEPPQGRGSRRDRWESLSALVALADEIGAGPDADLTTLVDELERRASAQHAPMADAVTLSTLHAAKGLEWDAVFLVGIHEGMLPISYATTPASVEEERRLLYVGITRARQVLHISWARARSTGGRGTREPSRFLDPLLPAEVKRPEQTVRTARRTDRRKARSVTQCRVCAAPLVEATARKLGRCVDCPSSYDEALLERLRDWRKVQAAADGLPAYCVFTDATLTAVAETAPADGSELLRISGVGRVKLDRFGAQVLAICAGQEP